MSDKSFDGNMIHLSLDEREAEPLRLVLRVDDAEGVTVLYPTHVSYADVRKAMTYLLSAGERTEVMLSEKSYT